MRKILVGAAVALLASAEWFASVSTTQDNATPRVLPAARKIAGLELAARVERSKDGKSVLVLSAFNPGKTEVKKGLELSVSHTRMMRMARMMPMPKEIAKRSVNLHLAAGERKEIRIEDPVFAAFEVKKVEKKVTFGASNLFQLVARAGKERVYLLSVSHDAPIRVTPVVKPELGKVAIK